MSITKENVKSFIKQVLIILLVTTTIFLFYGIEVISLSVYIWSIIKGISVWLYADKIFESYNKAEPEYPMFIIAGSLGMLGVQCPVFIYDKIKFPI